MNDVGGMEGFGPIPIDDGHIEADWQARFMALSSSLLGKVFENDEMRDAAERLDPVYYLTAPYWEKWLAAFELLLVEKGVLEPEDLYDPTVDEHHEHSHG